jgi:predicted permease
MATLFICIVIGYTLNKASILPKDAGKVMSKLIVWVFYPALCFVTMAQNCTFDTIKSHATNIIFSCIGVALAILLSALLVGLFAKKGTYERGVYRYALTFANSGYMGDPLVEDIFNVNVLSYYKIYCLPISLVIYTWGVGMLVPKKKGGAWAAIKKVINPPTVAMIIGMIFGFTGLNEYLPEFLTDSLGKLKGCMGPTAMLLAGFTVANYSLRNMLKNKKIYFATLLRVAVLPSIIIALLFAIKTLVNAAFGTGIDNSFLFLAFFAIATPLGLNTVVFPEAYGADPESGAGMTLISHTISVISIPVMYALMTAIFGSCTLL